MSWLAMIVSGTRNLLVGNWFGWLWVGWYTVLGVAILVFALVGTLSVSHGTGLLLVGASIFFAAVIPPRETLATSKNKLPTIATLLAAVFAYMGTAIALMRENAPLLGVIYLSTGYFGVLVALPVAVIARSLRR